MYILVFGHTGSIGKEIFSELSKNNIVHGFSSKEFDAKDPRQLQRMQNDIYKLKKIDAMVNCIGILDDPNSKINDNLNQLIQVNLHCAAVLSYACAEKMSKSGGGSIINLGSIASSFVRTGRIGYTLSKAGIEGLTKSLAFEYGKHQVLSNCVAPGPTVTKMLKNTLEKEELNLLERKIPVQRLCHPEDIASLVIFLIENNKYINGQTIVIDGGLTISSNF